MNQDISTLRQQLRGQPQPEVVGARSDSLFGRLFRRSDSWVRRYERHACCVIAVLEIVDKEVPVDGLVTEISEGGLLFRPASQFIFDRTGAEVIVRFSEDEVAGVIVNVKSHGYGVRFHRPVEEERVLTILERFGLPVDMAGE